DGKSILFLLEEGGTQHLARVPAGGGAVERIVAGERDVASFSIGPTGAIAVLESQTTRPPEISAVVGSGVNSELRRLTAVNDDFLRGIRLAKVQRMQVKDADGQAIDAFLTV